jgi:hypothetical protein
MSGVVLHCGDCLDIMPTLPAGSVDAIILDPPYGCGKAEWDDAFPIKWYSIAKTIAPMIAIITGPSGLKDSIPLVGDDFIDVIAAHNLNGMTRSPLGFGNWLACVVAGKKPAQGITFFEFVVKGDMPDHPSPKPIDYMRKLVVRLTKPGDTVLDPFMGSGTTGIACVETGRNFIGIENKPRYFEIARQRIAKVQRQPLLFGDGASAGIG